MGQRFFSRRPFGVELEMGELIPQENIADVITSTSIIKKTFVEDHYGQSEDNDFWHIKTDATCGLQKSGFEVASYKASGWEHLKDIADTTDALFEAGCRANLKCGFHVHVEVKDFSEHEMGKLLARWIKIEPFLCELMPAHRINNTYCKLLSASRRINKKHKLKCHLLWNRLRPTNFASVNNPQKRVTLNTVNYARYLSMKKKRCTVEFRMPEGTMEGKTVMNWVRFIVNFVDYAKSSAAPSNLEAVKNPKQFLKMSGLLPNKKTSLSNGLCTTSNWLLNRFLNFSFEKQKKEILSLSYWETDNSTEI